MAVQKSRKWTGSRQMKEAESIPESHLVALSNAGFVVLSYLDKAVKVRTADSTRTEWLPRLCIAPSHHVKTSYRVIEWLPLGHPANAYSFDGWSAYDGFTHGGMYKTIGSALSWFNWHDKTRNK